MTFLVILGDLACIATGFAIGFIFKEKIQGMVIGANALSARLHAKADAIAAATRKL